MTDCEQKSTTGLVVLAATPTPYFHHAFVRLTQEWLGKGLHVVYTHLRTGWTDVHAENYSTTIAARVGTDWDPSWRAKIREWNTGGRVIALLRDLRPRAILLHGYQDPCRWRVMRWSRRNRIPLFVWSDVNANGPRRNGWRGWVKQLYLGWIDRQVVAWLACGSRGVQYLQEYGVNRKRIFLSPCEPNYAEIVDVFVPEISSARAEFGLCVGRRRVVISGRFVETKRFDIAIRAFLAVAMKRPEWDLLVLGDGGLSDALHALVPGAMSHRVTWTSVVREPEKVWALYRACDVLLHVPDHEPWGLIVNEAACAGMAFVCTDAVGSAVELVRDRVNGRIVPCGDLVRATEALMDVTDEANLGRYRAASAPLLAAWRAAADPVEGLKKALASVGLKIN